MGYKVDYTTKDKPKIVLAEDAEAKTFIEAKRELLAYCREHAPNQVTWARGLRKADMGRGP